MPSQEKAYPDYETLEDRLLVANITLTPAYIHGIMLGVLCLGEEELAFAWEHTKSELPPLENLSIESDQMFESLFLLSAAHLKDLEQGVMPLLPDEEAALPERLAAMSEWCEGFLFGVNVGIGIAKVLIPLEAITEILEDFASIKDIIIEEECSEENEKAYLELVEFVRVGALLVHAECLDKTEDDGNFDKVH